MRSMDLRRPAAGTVAAVMLCAWCGWASGFHHSTTPAFATWSASLALVVIIDCILWRAHLHRHDSRRRVSSADRWPRTGHGGFARTLLGASPWLALSLVVLAWELLGIDTGADAPHLTISALAQVYRPLDAALLLVWILVGIGYGAARAQAPAEEHREGGEPAIGMFSAAAIGTRHMVPALLLPHSKAIGVAFWVGVTVVCLTVEQVARRSGGRLATAGELVRLISRKRVVNATLVLAWAYAGWHLFAH
ncbi:MAG: DUF6186 family protein [Acidimicrobiales bacterium]